MTLSIDKDWISRDVKFLSLYKFLSILLGFLAASVRSILLGNAVNFVGNNNIHLLIVYFTVSKI